MPRGCGRTCWACKWPHAEAARQPNAALLPAAAGCHCSCRLAHVARGRGWDTESAAIWPPAFKAAARALLLAARRLASTESSTLPASRAQRAARRALRAGGGDAGVATLGSLPRELLLAVLERAAFPMSAWMLD